MESLCIDSDITTAQTISSSFYTSPQWYELVKEKIFTKTWQFCLNTDELRLSKQMVPVTMLPGLLDEPLLFTRDEQETIRCMSNVCTHRGNILVDSPCISDKIKCRYHGRRFSLCGDFIHMPEFDQAKNFPSVRDNLPQVAFGNLGKFMFASLDPTATFEDVFGNIKQRLNWLPFEQMHFDANRSRDYLVHAHWALYVENYLEELHIPFVHPGLRSVLDFANYKTEISRYSNLQFALASKGEEAFDLPPESPDYGQSVAAYYYWIFPNTMLNFYPWGCSVNVVKPMGLSLTKVSFLTFVLDESKLGRGAGGELDKVEREDEAVVENVQKGIRSRLYHAGRYSPTREKGTHHFHQLLSEFLR